MGRQQRAFFIVTRRLYRWAQDRILRWRHRRKRPWTITHRCDNGAGHGHRELWGVLCRSLVQRDQPVEPFHYPQYFVVGGESTRPGRLPKAKGSPIQFSPNALEPWQTVKT